MARYTAWKTVIGDREKKHRSENATYKYLRDWATGQPDGAKVSVYVQETGSDRWHTFEHLAVQAGELEDVA